jgi:hypothetical protein
VSELDKECGVLPHGSRHVEQNEFTGLATARRQDQGGDLDARTFPLGAGDDLAEGAEPTTIDPLAGAATIKRYRGGLILIAAVVLAGAGGVFTMKKLADVGKSGVLNTEVESLVQKFIEARDRGASIHTVSAGGTETESHPEWALAVLTQSYSERQVPIQDVQRDPFVISGFDEPTTTIPTPTPGTTGTDRYETARSKRKAEMEDAGAALVVKAILGGVRPLAIVGDETVHVGDTISAPGDVPFRVASIASGAVEVVAIDPEYQLEVTLTLHLARDR